MKIIKTKTEYLNILDIKQLHSTHLYYTFFLVSMCTIIQPLLVLWILNGWHTIKSKIFMAYPQAPIENDMYMELPHGVGIRQVKYMVLKLLNNLYGQKQAYIVWNEYLANVLQSTLSKI